MPTYSYACRACGHAFDIRQSFSDDPLTECPDCSQPTLRKVIHPVGITFKGSGFYKTDSRAGSKPAAPAASGAEAGAGAAAASGSGSAAGSDGSAGSGSSGSASSGSGSSASGSSGSGSAGSGSAAGASAANASSTGS